MKLTNTRSIKSAKGMTLLELTVVILVLLSLISILFVGARAWKKGADKAASVMVIRNTQQAVRSFANLHNVNAGDVPTSAQMAPDTSLNAALFGQDKFMVNDPTGATFAHPAGAGYTYVAAAADTVPLIGVLYIKTGGTGNNGAPADFDPSTTEITSW